MTLLGMAQPIAFHGYSHELSGLDAVFLANISSLVHNDAYDLDFVYHPEPYSAFHNSNEVVADWLEELGCRVMRPSLFFTWKLDAPARWPSDAAYVRPPRDPAPFVGPGVRRIRSCSITPAR